MPHTDQVKKEEYRLRRNAKNREKYARTRAVSGPTEEELKKDRERAKIYRELHREEINEKRRVLYRDPSSVDRIRQRDRDRYAEDRYKRVKTSRRSNLKVKIETIDAYGGECAICGEFHIECLTIDHSFGDGGKFRKAMLLKTNRACGGSSLYRFLRNQGFPKDLGLRVLCFNCNCSIGAYGYSPYET